MSKYRNRKTTVDGVRFDSKAEAARYRELKLLQTGGLIRDLQLQPAFELQPKYRYNGKTVRAIKYIGDFSYLENGVRVVEDVKGKATEVFKLKAKLFQFKYPDIDFRVVAA